MKRGLFFVLWRVPCPKLPLVHGGRNDSVNSNDCNYLGQLDCPTIFAISLAFRTRSVDQRNVQTIDCMHVP